MSPRRGFHSWGGSSSEMRRMSLPTGPTWASADTTTPSCPIGATTTAAVPTATTSVGTGTVRTRPTRAACL